MNRRMGGDKSLNVAVSDEDDNEKIDLLVDSRQNIEERLSRRQEQNLRNKILRSSLAQLSDRERDVIRARMLTENPLTLEELGNKMGVSRERIRQIEKKAFEKLSSLVRAEMAVQKDAA